MQNSIFLLPCARPQYEGIKGKRLRSSWVVRRFCLCQEESRLKMGGKRRQKVEFQALSKHPSSWKWGLAKRKRTNINQYRCYFQASEWVFQSRLLAQESDPCPVAAVFYVPNPPLTFSILTKSLHTSALTL